ncbi:hypothetical protein HRbin36_02797 [bacterium HR36]|nr:hypothetical protein HRbin36_02797 [bacterium HR36]
MLQPKNERARVCWRITVWTALVAAMVGCGVDEYNARVNRTRERLQKYDEEDALLGEPVHLPQATLPVYLRLPREIQPTPAPQSPIHGLARFPWQTTPGKLPVLEAYVGFIPSKQIPVPDILLQRIVGDLQADSGGLEQVSDEPQVLEPRRDWESSQLLEANRSVRYRLWVRLAPKEIPRDAQGQPLPLPAGFTAVFRYEIYLHHVEASANVGEEGHVAVVFHQLDVEATRQRWEQLLANQTKPTDIPEPAVPSTPAPFQNPAQREPGVPEQLSSPQSGATATSSPVKPTPKPIPQADLLNWLPAVDKQHLERVKLATLASLRVGEAARQRLHCWGR